MRIATLLLCLLPFTVLANEKEVKTDITSVKVFRSGAQIERNATVNLPAGKSTIVFTQLSEEVNPSSVQVKGLGDFTILSVKTRLDFMTEKVEEEKVQVLEDRLKAIQQEKEDLKAQDDALRSEQSLLNQNMRIGGEQSGTDITALKEAAAFIQSRMLAINKALLTSKRKVEKLDEEARKIGQQLVELRTVDSETTSEILVEVEAKRPMQAGFTFSYLVASAGWAPLYDIRVESVAEPVHLTYKAQIFQSTGVDWSDIDLTISSGDPTANNVMPEIKPWYLTLDRPTYPSYPTQQQQAKIGINEVRGIVRDANTGEPLPFVNVMVLNGSGQILNGTTTNFDGYYVVAVPPGGSHLKVTYIGYQDFSQSIVGNNININLSQDNVQLDEVMIVGSSKRVRRNDISKMPSSYNYAAASTTVANTVQQRATTFEFEIDVKYDIPSDGKYHMVGIKEVELPATYTYYATPKLDLDAFLFAKVTGWEDEQLVDGTANIFFENTNVGETQLNLQQVSDTIDLSLGRDKDVVVTREKRKDYTTKQFIGNKKTETITWDLAVRNNKSQAITLKLYDQIPVSQQQEVEVTLEEESGSPDLNADKGILTWDFELAPASDEKVFFQYSVKYPKNRRIYLE